MPLIAHGLGYGGKLDPAHPTKNVRNSPFHFKESKHTSTHESAFVLQESGCECHSREHHGAFVSLVSGWSAIQNRAAATDILLRHVPTTIHVPEEPMCLTGTMSNNDVPIAMRLVIQWAEYGWRPEDSIKFSSSL